MVGLYIILTSYIVFSVISFIIMVGAHGVTQDKLDNLKEHLSDIQIRIDDINDKKENESKEDDESEEKDEKGLENLASSVFNLVDDILDGKKELEDINNEEQSNI